MERLTPRAGRVCHLEVGEGGVDDRAVAVRLGRQHPLAVGVVGEGRRLGCTDLDRRQAVFHVKGQLIDHAALGVLGQVAPPIVALHGQGQVGHAHQPGIVIGGVAIVPRRAAARDHVEVAQPDVGVAATERAADRTQPVELVVGVGAVSVTASTFIIA